MVEGRKIGINTCFRNMVMPEDTLEIFENGCCLKMVGTRYKEG